MLQETGYQAKFIGQKRDNDILLIPRKRYTTPYARNIRLDYCTSPLVNLIYWVSLTITKYRMCGIKGKTVVMIMLLSWPTRWYWNRFRYGLFRALRITVCMTSAYWTVMFWILSFTFALSMHFSFSVHSVVCQVLIWLDVLQIIK